MAAKSKALIAAEERINELKAQLEEKDALVALEKEEAKLEQQLAEQDKVDADKEIAELKTAIGLSAESEKRLLAELENMEAPQVINGQVQAAGCQIFKGNEFTEYLLAKGIKIVSKFDVETLRTFINSDWSPSMVMEKFGLTEAQLQSYVWKLSTQERRGDRPIKLDFKRDVFGREG